MGIYLNPGNKFFRQAVTDDIYVDKTEMIANINYSDAGERPLQDRSNHISKRHDYFSDKR